MLGQTVNILFKVTNVKDESITINFSSGRQFDVIIKDDNNKLWQLSSHMNYTNGSNTLTLNPGETHTYQAQWNQDVDGHASIPSGAYTTEAFLTSVDKKYRNIAATEFTITAPNKLFEVEFTNYSWGYVHRGFYIDNKGKVFSYQRGAEDKLVDTIEPNILLEKCRLIETARRAYFPGWSLGCCDQGDLAFLCYQFDPNNSTVKKIELHPAGGGFPPTISSENSQALSFWLATLPSIEKSKTKSIEFLAQELGVDSKDITFGRVINISPYNIKEIGFRSGPSVLAMFVLNYQNDHYYLKAFITTYPNYGAECGNLTLLTEFTSEEDNLKIETRKFLAQRLGVCSENIIFIKAIDIFPEISIEPIYRLVIVSYQNDYYYLNAYKATDHESEWKIKLAIVIK